MNSTEKQNHLSFLLSATWWRASLALIRPLCPAFFLPACLMVLSNISAVFTDLTMKSGLNQLLLLDGQFDVQKALCLCLGLMLAGIIATALGLVSFSIWLLQLTALARMLLSAPEKSFQESVRELKSQGKYLTTVWLLGFLYLLGPVMPMSVLMAFSIMSSYRLALPGESMVGLPPELLLPVNLVTGVLFLLAIDYSLLLTVLSSTAVLRPRTAAALACDILFKRFGEIAVLNFFLLLLNIGVSAPFSLLPLIPPLERFASNFALQVGFQLWFGLTSMITWPLSILLFADFLKPYLGKPQAAEV